MSQQSLSLPGYKPQTSEQSAPKTKPSIRTQEEIVVRFRERMLQHDYDSMPVTECDVYLDAMTPESYGSIAEEFSLDATMKFRPSTDSEAIQSVRNVLLIWKNAVEQKSEEVSQRCLVTVRGYKWLLGHPDADSFPGVPGSKYPGGYVLRDALAYIVNQFETGAWDRLTKVAKRTAEERQKSIGERVIEGLPEPPSVGWRGRWEAMRGGVLYTVVEKTPEASENDADAPSTLAAAVLYLNGNYAGQYSSAGTAMDAVDRETAVAGKIG